MKIIMCDLFAYHRMHLDDSRKQLRLAVVCLLRARLGDFSVHFALKCSSLCTMNVGTSKRSPCCSLGFAEYPSVFMSNKLTERRCGYSVKKCFERNIIEPFPSHGLTGYVGFPCRFCRQPKSKPLLMPFLTRTCALVLLETVLRGAWTVEQPNGSVLEFYPTWRTVMRNIFVVGGIGAVPRCTPSSLTTFLKAIPPPTKYQSPMIYVSLISI